MILDRLLRSPSYPAGAAAFDAWLRAVLNSIPGAGGVGPVGEEGTAVAGSRGMPSPEWACRSSAFVSG